MNGRTATVRHIAREEHVSIPEPAEQWPSAWGHGGIAFSRNFAADAARRLPEFTEYRLADMDATGIDVQVLPHTVPGVQAGLDAATARDHARLANDYPARVAAGHPDGRPMRRASATPCSRYRSASLTRVVQTSVLPKLTSASARRSWPMPDCAVSGASAMARSPLCLLGHRLRVRALAGVQQPDDPQQQQLRLGAPGVRHPRRPPLRQVPVPLRPIQRSVHQLIRRGHRRELGIGRADTGQEPSEQLMGNGGLPVRYRPGQ